jgi:NADPH2:quinone reductase
MQAARVLPLPPGFDLDDGAAFAFTYGTSHHALMDRGAAAGRRDRAGAGRRRRRGHGRGADRQGGRRARDRRRLQRRQVRVPEANLGADATINYTSANLRDALKALTEGKGPDVIYDPVGGDLAEPAFRSIAWRGRYLVVGFAAGAIPALPLNLALLKGASIVGVFWGDFVRREPKAFAAGMAQLAQWYAEGKVKPAIDCKLPMSRAARSLRAHGLAPGAGQGAADQRLNARTDGARRRLPGPAPRSGRQGSPALA